MGIMEPGYQNVFQPPGKWVDAHRRSNAMAKVLEFDCTSGSGLNDMIKALKDDSLPDDITVSVSDRLIRLRTPAERAAFIIGIALCFDIIDDEWMQRQFLP